MTSFAKVDVKEIKSNVLRSNFSEAEIEKLADLILESGGILKPLILKQNEIDSYLVLDGHLEYYAAVRAREKNPQQGETVNAFVISSKNEAVIQKQIQVLNDSNKLSDDSNQQSSTVPKSTNQERNSDWITSFEMRLSEIREILFQTKRDHEYRFIQIDKNFQEKQKLDLLDLLNTLEKQVLIEQLSRYGIQKDKIEAIYNARNQKEHKKFDSYQDVVKVTKGLGAGGMLGLVDVWARANKTAQ
ncbi:hypothetical protein [Nostoc sp.]|uniref:hypothetical protein n=1 Tax=Nostoc sp. TaxID=1180 RepID=UPI003593990D